MKLPKHECAMIITHNEHKNNYMTVDQFDNDFSDWINAEEKLKSILTNEVWTIQFYPITPIGFYAISASSLHVLLDYVNSNYETEEYK